MPADRCWSGGSNDPVTGVILVVAGLGALVAFPWRIARARERAAPRNALAAALRG